MNENRPSSRPMPSQERSRLRNLALVKAAFHESRGRDARPFRERSAQRPTSLPPSTFCLLSSRFSAWLWILAFSLTTGLALAATQPGRIVRLPSTNADPAAAAAVAATNDIRDIRGPVDIPYRWAWLLWLLVGVALAVAAFFLIRAWLRRRRRLALAPVVVLPPHVRARNQLEAALAWISQPDPFCTRVSQTLRIYLEERFSLHAPERTTEEFLDELQSSPMLAQPQKQSLGDFLMRCDLVKFARHEPAEPELRDLWDSAVRLVDETAPTAANGPDNASAGEDPPLATSPAPEPQSTIRNPKSGIG